MRTCGATLAACLVLVISRPAATQTATAEAPEIVVNGVGMVSYVPDRATVMVEVRTEAQTPAEAARGNAPVMDSVIAALRRNGIRADRINTRGYTVQPTYHYDQSGPRLTGYAATNGLTVKLDDAGMVGATLDAALAAGANRVGSVRFESSNMERLRRQALERAVANARQDAEALARAAGGSLGELIAISTDTRPTREEFMQNIAAAPSYARGIETPINTGEQTLVVGVQARWRFVRQ